nr:structure-specific endonuclease subunit SLX1 isoform X1 [Ipomoea batatas]
MVLCIYGFPTNVSALQFEWAWQHPKESLAVREAAVSFKAFGGVANKIKMAYTMLTLPAWQRLNLTVNFFSTKYTKHAAGCPILPEHIKVRVCPMDDLPCYSGISWDSCEHDEYDDEECDRIGGSQELADEGSVESNSSRNSTAADIEESIEQNATGKTNLTEQMISKKHKWDQGTTRLRDSPSPKENHGHSSFTNFPWPSSPFGIRSNNILDCTEDELRFEDSDVTFHHQTNKLPETIVISNQHPSQKTSEVEIIDICTPPPPCIRNAIDKRTTLSTAFPEIIDLTESPIFI